MRRLPGSAATTLPPTTVQNTVQMQLPPQGEELLTKTYLTTYTYVTTLLEKGQTVESSRREIVSNVVTEERRPVSPTGTAAAATQVSLTASPSLATGVFHTTYTYLNTLVDGEKPLVVTSKRTVSNTVTAPHHLLEPSEPPAHDTNTYLSTVQFTKTLADGADFKIVSTKDVMTQVIITESDNKATAVEVRPTATPAALTTDVVKTYFVTYTYFSTMLDGTGETVVKSEVATSSDIVTEKFVIPPHRRTDAPPVEPTATAESPERTENPINVFATKTYQTTFTYFTTLLQENSGTQKTVVSSRTNVVQNVVTETLKTELLDSDYLASLRSSLQTDGQPIVATATLTDGQMMEITAVGDQSVRQTATPELSSSFEETSSKNNVVTGSTIIFFDEDDQIDATPAAASASQTLTIESAGQSKATTEREADTQEASTEGQSESLSAAESQALTVVSGDSEAQDSQQSYETLVLASPTVTKTGATLQPGEQVIKFKDASGNVSVIPVSDPVSKHPDGSAAGANTVSNFLKLGSLGINSLNALGPVINAMAGLIKSNLKTDQTRRNDSIAAVIEPSDLQLSKNPLLKYAGPKPPPARSPIYIPVRGLAADSAVEESQNYESRNTFHDTNRRNKLNVILGRPTMESPLLAGGIPISPGQVITTNSDVIIGKHSAHGPRPPVPPQSAQNNVYRKDDVPIGMKPPPPPHKTKPTWPVRDQGGHYIPLGQNNREPPYRTPQRERPNQHRDPGNYNVEYMKHTNPQKKPLFNNRPTSYNDYYSNPPRKDGPGNLETRPSNKPYYHAQQNIPVYNSFPNNNFDTRPVSGQNEAESANSIGGQFEYAHQQSSLLPDNTNYVDQSAINPLLVNIRPSQVANVIIPHGSSTALIYGGEHSQKGEIFSEPSPYPDARVEHVVDALSTARPQAEGGEGITHAARVPANADNLEVAVAPHGINVANNAIYKIEQSQQVYQEHQVHPYYKPENKPNAGEYLRPPPPPDDRYRGPERPVEDEFVFGEDPVDQEGGELTQESNARPVLPGLRPSQEYKPSTSMPIDLVDEDRQSSVNAQIDYNRRPEAQVDFNRRPEAQVEYSRRPEAQIDYNRRPEATGQNNIYIPKPESVRPKPSVSFNSRPDSEGQGQDINFSVVNSKPVQLDGLSSLDNQAPIIKGKPGVNQFTDKSQATLAVGVPTNLKPNDPPVYNHEQRYGPNSRPEENPPSFVNVNQGATNNIHPIVVQPVYVEEKKPQKKVPKPVRDNTLQTMNLDENPPPLPGFEVPPPKPAAPVDLDSQANTPRPFSVPTNDRNSQQDDSMIGLSPPPPQKLFPPREETSTGQILNLGSPHKVNPPRKPGMSHPYEFEIPPPVLPERRPTLAPVMEPPRPPPQGLPETLSPPTLEASYYDKVRPVTPPPNNRPQKVAKPIVVMQQEPSMNPVKLEGVLSVAPEVITADSKVVMSNVIKGRRPKPEGGIKISGAGPSLQQTVVVGLPIAVPIKDIPAPVTPTTKVETTEKSQDGKDSFIVGSETIIDERPYSATPLAERPSESKSATVLVTTGVTTIFDNHFTRPTERPRPTETTQSHHSVVSVVVTPKENRTATTTTTTTTTTEASAPVEAEVGKKDRHEVVLTIVGGEDYEETDDIVTAPPATNRVVTHTRTTTVTPPLETRTRTLVYTRTHTSTLLDTVTEVETLTRQTSVLTTVTTTLPQATATVFAPGPSVTGSVEPDVPYEAVAPSLPSPRPPADDPRDNDSILIVMKANTDKGASSPTVADLPDVQLPDEANEISPNEVLRAGVGVFTQESDAAEAEHGPGLGGCRPDCRAERNEQCRRTDGQARCVCRPGFARMFPDRPCKPTYTYTVRLVLGRHGPERVRLGAVADPASAARRQLTGAAKDGLDRAVMQSDLRDVYHGLEVAGFEPAVRPDDAVVKFHVQLSENTEETRLQEVLKKALRANNFSLGGTDLFADAEQIQHLLAEDFDECSDPKYHDCSENSQCFNLRGSYTCSCQDGYSDLSPNAQFPGRVCAEQSCELCNYHGTCFTRNDEEIVCECFQWYGGATCQINLKVLLLVLVTVAVCLVVLLAVCCVLGCMRRRELAPAGTGYRRYRHQPGTGDKRAMIAVDTASEASADQTPPTTYVRQATMAAQRHQKAVGAGAMAARKAKAPAPSSGGGTMEQRDRSLTVMIPRAKYRPAPAPPASTTLLTMSTFGPSEQKLLNLLTPCATPDNKQGSRNTSRKPSDSTNRSEQIRSRKPSSQPTPVRKPSAGALVSAGFEVSATVGRTTELDEAFLAAPHTDLGRQPQFDGTVRTAESCIIVNIPPPPTLEAELEDIIHKVDRLTVSEARSYDETTVQPPTKTLRHPHDHDHSTSSHTHTHTRANDEGHTMVERDLGSTFTTPQTHLFKNDRGSDISNFDSL